MSNDEVSTTEPVVAATTTETSAAPVAKLAKVRSRKLHCRVKQNTVGHFAKT